MKSKAGVFIISLLASLLRSFNRVDKKGIRALVTFETSEKKVTFECEVAEEEKRGLGLMNRHHLENDNGMLFIIDPPEKVSCWMKNTYIPLDIIFISPDLKVLNMHEAEPGAGMVDHDLPHYTSNGACGYVVEVNKGESMKNGIEAGIAVVIDLRDRDGG